VRALKGRFIIRVCAFRVAANPPIRHKFTIKDGRIVMPGKLTEPITSRFFCRIFFWCLWLLSLTAVTIVSVNNDLNSPYSNLASYVPAKNSTKNEIKGLSYTKCDSDQNGSPVYTISFEKLLAENNKLGIFKTGLHKIVRISDLRLVLHNYSCCQTQGQSELDQDIAAKTDVFGVSNGIDNSIKPLTEIINKLKSSDDIWRIDIDLSNVSEVLVNDFDYNVFCDNELVLRIQSKRAIASYKRSDLLLRGHVILTNAAGGKLESNYVKWDVGSRSFSVKGFYVLNRNGIRKMGKDICLDSQLNNIKTKHAKINQREEQKCFAKLRPLF